MELNQSTLRGILAAILSVDESFVVPKQGNWWNPQENLEGKPYTWCAYRIKSNKPRTAPYYFPASGTAEQNRAAVQKIADIELQFVGTDSETLAENVAMWPLRSDVRAQFSTVHGSVMYDDMTAFSTPFAQEGTNTVMAWNVTFRVLWVSLLNATQDVLTSAYMGGQINV